MGETIQDWTQTPELNKALVEAREDIHNPKFDSENPYFGSKFASLRAVIESVIPVMSEHGIAVVQDLQTIENGIACYTHLLHTSGESMTLGPLILHPTKSDPQGFGGAGTYARRYHLMAVGCVVGDPDDDGNAITGTSFKSKQTKTKYWKGLRDAASENDSGKARELWDELDSEQQMEIWREFSSGIRSTIKELLKSTGETE